MTAQKYRKKPVEIEAMQWDGGWDSFLAITEWAGGYPPLINLREYAETESDTTHLMIHTLEGSMRAEPNDWVIRGVKGEFYPCKPDIFEATYTAVRQPDPDPVREARLRLEEARLRLRDAEHEHLEACRAAALGDAS